MIGNTCGIFDLIQLRQVIYVARLPTTNYSLSSHFSVSILQRTAVRNSFVFIVRSLFTTPILLGHLAPVLVCVIPVNVAVTRTGRSINGSLALLEATGRDLCCVPLVTHSSVVSCITCPSVLRRRANNGGLVQRLLCSALSVVDGLFHCSWFRI
jgi:hypothetical protein